MPEQNYTMLFSEILDKVSKAKTKEEKVTILRENNTDALRIVLKSSFDPKIEWVFPEGTVPYTPNEAPAGTEHTMLASEAKKLWHYIKGADNATKQHQKELMFFQLLEGLHSSEAELICRAKDKKLHQIYKGLSSNVVREAFGWNEEFVVPKPDEYPQSPGMASGADR
tara:strand:- start:335 stop:838 length:504 start_codon:yes stop_codon:yes gene_type:complete